MRKRTKPPAEESAPTMSPKEKVNATSSESTSSSNTSSSSSSSSSSSGSDSSSSDSENSSSSQPSAAKSHGSSDSDNRKDTKKKAPPAKGKNSSASDSKTKEKATSSKGKNSKTNVSTNYSSESEDVPVKPPPKRKPPPKPKATATVTPINKPKQPASRAKAAATKSAGANTTSKDKKGAASKQAESAAQKKLKTKSIFSPENSSESDDQGAQPPKLSPMKSTAKVVSHSKPKPKVAAKAEPTPASTSVSKSNSSATSTSASSASSDSSSDSESSADSSATAKPAKKKACTIKKISTSAANSARARSEAQPASKAPPSTAAAESGESDGGAPKPVVTRKSTRSSSARRSKHLIGKTSDTESENEGKAKVAPTKKSAGPKGPAQRPKTKGRGAANVDTLQKPVEEERKCPLEGCDSLGHLSGKLDKHFTIDSCPIYHNTTAQECKNAYMERRKHEDERRRAITAMNKKSLKGHLTLEQRHYQMKVKEFRSKFKPQATDQEENTTSEGKEREPRLLNLVPDYDLKLFQEAQAIASEKIEEDLKILPHVKGTKYVEMGKYEMEVWYQSPYPEEYTRVPKLYICEYCLRYMKSRTILKRHTVKCVWRHPPGEEVYRKDKISVWEVDGKRYKQYCQNLCLLAKFFLDHKTLYYDVEPFLFYVMTIGDSEGCHTVGYFSKEKNSFLNYNVSCILTLPPYQRQGYGRLLIDFSYLLTRVERKIGSPEKPLSDLGLISYRSYWKDVLLEYLCKFGGKELSIKDLSQEMAINSYDIVSTLQALGMMKYWKGKHIILKKQDVIEEYEERMKRRGSNYKEIDPSHLKWTPFVAPPSAGPP